MGKKGKKEGGASAASEQVTMVEEKKGLKPSTAVFADIETGIPVPEDGRAVKSVWKEALLALGPGQSRCVQGVGLDTVKGACMRVGNAQTPKRKFVVRALEGEYAGWFRIWRKADEVSVSVDSAAPTTTMDESI